MSLGPAFLDLWIVFHVERIETPNQTRFSESGVLFHVEPQIGIWASQEVDLFHVEPRSEPFDNGGCKLFHRNSICST